MDSRSIPAVVACQPLCGDTSRESPTNSQALQSGLTLGLEGHQVLLLRLVARQHERGAKLIRVASNPSIEQMVALQHPRLSSLVEQARRGERSQRVRSRALSHA